MATIIARIPRDDGKTLDQLVEKGHFLNRSDAIRSAVRLLIHTMTEEPEGAKA